MSITQIHGGRLRDASIELSKLSAAVQATLDSVADKANTADLIGGDNKLLPSLLPDVVFGSLKYQGVWNAATNTPAIPAAAASNAGFYYKVGVSGTTQVDGESDWVVGDWIVSNGTSWDKIDNSEKTEDASTTYYNRSLKGLLRTSDVQNALDELAVASNVKMGTENAATGLVVDFATPSNTHISNFVVGYSQAGLFPPLVAGQTVLNLVNGRVYTVLASGAPALNPDLQGLAVYKVKYANRHSDNEPIQPAGVYVLHRDWGGNLQKTRISFDDMIFDSGSQKTVKDKIKEMDTNTALAARMLTRAVPVGSVDGSNVAFTLFAAKLVTGTDQVFLDGMLLEPTEDYVLTESGADTVLTFTVAPPVGSRIRISGVKA